MARNPPQARLSYRLKSHLPTHLSHFPLRHLRVNLPQPNLTPLPQNKFLRTRMRPCSPVHYRNPAYYNLPLAILQDPVHLATWTQLPRHLHPADHILYHLIRQRLHPDLHH